jgi:type II restriction enzyme
MSTWESGILTLIRERWSVGETFLLGQVYESVKELASQHPENTHANDKVRQVLQYLRDKGDIEFLGGTGLYRRVR